MPVAPDPASVWVVIPAFDEGQVIASVLEGLLRFGYNVVVVDDGSSDDTSSQVSSFPVTLLRHPVNLGQGAALQTGISFALARGAAIVVTFDADGQHDERDVAALVAPLESGQCEVCLGSRFLDGGEPLGIPLRRRLVLSVGTWFTRLTSGLALTDTYNGMRAFTAEAASQIHIRQNRMAHGLEILYQVASLKLRYREAPVRVRYSAYSLGKGERGLDPITIIWDIVKGRML